MQLSNWQVSHVIETSSRYSSRLWYAPQDPKDRVSVVFIFIPDLDPYQNEKETLLTYVDLFSGKLSSLPEKENQILVYLQINDKVYVDYSYRHEGGQRMTLTKYLQEPLIDALQKNHKVKISFSGYTILLDPFGFQKAYSKFSHCPKNRYFSSFYE